MIESLLGLSAISGAVRLAGNALHSLTAGSSNPDGYAEVQRRMIAARGDIDGSSETGRARRLESAESHERVWTQQAERMMRRIDSDGDGVLNASELGLTADAFSRIDSNQDGGVDSSELAQGLKQGLVDTWSIQ